MNFCVGAPKTGTTTVYRMCKRGLRASHEGAREVHVLIAAAMKAMPYDLYHEATKATRQLKVDVLSSQFLAPTVIDHARAFPNAKFLLTARDPFAWLRSMINQSLRSDGDAYTRVMRQMRYGGGSYTDADRHLSYLKLYPVEGYLQGWAQHNRSVLFGVTEGRLKVVWTQDLSKPETARSIEKFFGLRNETLETGIVANAAPAGRHAVFDMIDRDYIHDTIERVCTDTLDRLKALGDDRRPRRDTVGAGGGAARRTRHR